MNPAPRNPCSALRRYFEAQIEEIRADTALRLYGVFLALAQVLCFRAWIGTKQVELLSNRGEPLCWPFFEDCSWYRVFAASACPMTCGTRTPGSSKEAGRKNGRGGRGWGEIAGRYTDFGCRGGLCCGKYV